MWKENGLVASAAAVGILIPQFFWCIDFLFELFGQNLSGMTSYMFDERRSLFLRSLSLFHGWLPFLLLYLVYKLGYHSKGLPVWTCIAWVACLVAFFFLPPAGAEVPSVNTPLNVNYVFGIDDTKPQTWMAAELYLCTWMLGLLLVFFIPTHMTLKKYFSKSEPASVDV